jgi:hypothetical protein
MPSPSLVELLVRANLMQLYLYTYFHYICLLRSEVDDAVRITNAGFKFLLKDTYNQIWTLLLEYIEASEVGATYL